jgi:glycosyltransferase involved in cell wall biosynthesis
VSGNFLGLSTYTSVSGHTVYTGTFGTNPPAFLDDVPIDGTVYTLQWEFLQDQPECPLPASGSFVEELLQTANHTIYDPIDCNTYIGYPLEGELSESSFPKMEIVEDLDTNSVLYLHFDDSTGYGNAARGYIKDLEESGIDVQKMDISNESTPPNSPYHTVIIHAPAPIWKMYLNKYGDVWKNCKIIGNTVWETETAPVGWVEPMDMVDEIWLPTNWNQKTFIDAGVKTPILVKPHIFVGDKDYKKVNQLGDIQKGDDYVFYSIGVWSDSRKRMGDLIRLFCKTFTGNDQVQLVVKTSYKGYEKKNLETCHKEAAAIINRFSNPPKIHIITDQYDDSMISKLHGYGDCFVSLTHTEGWGLGAFEAHSYGKPVIITGFGGQLEYLGDDYPGLINYTKVPCSSKDFPDYHSWAEPDEKHASVLMKATYEHRP